MKSKILIIGLIAIIVIVAVFLVLQKEDVKINNSNEAINLIKEKYPEFVNVIDATKNLSVENISNGWRIEINVYSNTTPKIEKNITSIFVYKNGSIEKTEKTVFIKELTEEKAIALIKEKYPETANISKCEDVTCSEDIIIEEMKNGWNLTFWNGSVDCRDDCLFKDYHHFLVYENGSVIKVGGEKWVNKTIRIWTDKLEYEKGEIVKVYIFNGLDDDISFYLKTYPSDINIEKWENDRWNQYSITSFKVYEVKSPPNIVNPNKLFAFKWDQRYYIIWKDKELVNKPIINQPGKYRFVFKPINLEIFYYSNEFKIIK